MLMPYQYAKTQITNHSELCLNSLSLSLSQLKLEGVMHNDVFDFILILTIQLA